MTGTLRKKGHPASEALGTAEVESVGTVKVGRAGGTVRIGGKPGARRCRRERGQG